MTLGYCCPRCKQPVHRQDKGYRCEPCGQTYPVVLDIPDFRIYPDPYISIEDDYAKAARILDAGSFEQMIRLYWSTTPDTPPHMAQRFIEHSMAGEERGRHLIGRVANLSDREGGRAIELGCRTGGVTVSLAERFDHVVGIDIALRWLVVARRRLEEAGQQAQLACCCADSLPFEERSFDLVLAENVLEHTAAQQDLIDEAHRALKPGGAFLATTWNRVSPAREPHVGLFFVGWQPRWLAKRYVKHFSGTDYDHVRLLSWYGLRRIVRRSPFSNHHARITPHTFAEQQIGRLGPLSRVLIRLYSRLSSWPMFRQLCLLVGPVLEVVCVRGRGTNSRGRQRKARKSLPA